MKEFAQIKNIIFDLGAVIIPIDFNKTFQAFSDLSNLSIEEIKRRYMASNIFADFEKGLIGNYKFILEVRTLLGLSSDISDQDIVDAWNVLLLQIPKERIERIQELATRYRLFLLSNTNPIHITEVHGILHSNTGIDRLEKIFEKVWYSYDLGLIKPHTNIYETVLKQKKLNAAETVFLDDNADNVAGAKKIGIEALLVTDENNLLQLLKHA
jgi:FMN phosphatase YigB (HAD superfamily)